MPKKLCPFRIITVFCNMNKYTHEAFQGGICFRAEHRAITLPPLHEKIIPKSEKIWEKSRK